MSIREYTDKDGKSHFFLNHYPEGRRGRRINLPLPGFIASLDEARHYVETTMEALSSPGKEEIAGTTLVSLWPSYLAHIRREKRPRTYEDVEDAGNHLCRILGPIAPSELDRGYLNLYKDTRLSETHHKYKKTPTSRRTINKELSWLSGFLTWCADNGIETPANLTITKFPYKRPIPVVLSVDEAIRIILAAEPLYRSFFGCLYLGGMRFSEAQQLRRQDIDDDNRQAIVTGKGDKQRILPLPPFLLAWISEIKPRGTTGYVHTQKRNPGQPIWPPKTALLRAAKKAGVTKHVYPHLLRHSFGTHQLTEWGTDIKTLQQYLGHANLQATEWYLHVTHQNVTKAAKAMTDSLQATIERFSTEASGDSKEEEVLFSTC